MITNNKNSDLLIQNARMAKAIAIAIELNRTIEQNGTKKVLDFDPEGWMPPGKRQDIFKILSEAIVD